MTDIYETECVVAAVQEVRADLARLLQQRIDKLYTAQPLLDACESPIEVVWGVWWLGLALLCQMYNRPFPYAPEAQYDVECNGEWYRLDFAFPEQKIAVELDGHAFHERTVDQVIARDTRDRHLQVAGWRVLHWSGTELLRAPASAIEQLHDHLEAIAPRVTLPVAAPSQALIPTPKRGR